MIWVFNLCFELRQINHFLHEHRFIFRRYMTHFNYVTDYETNSDKGQVCVPQVSIIIELHNEWGKVNALTGRDKSCGGISNRLRRRIAR